jgi:hypothetical protein
MIWTRGRCFVVPVQFLAAIFLSVNTPRARGRYAELPPAHVNPAVRGRAR